MAGTRGAYRSQTPEEVLTRVGSSFGVLLLPLHATPEQSRTGWFIESVVPAALIVLAVRSRRPFFRSRPGRQLRIATGAIASWPSSCRSRPSGRSSGSCPLPVLVAMGMIVLLDIVSAEGVKRAFYHRRAA